MEQVKHLLGVWLFPWKKLNMCKADLSKWLFAGLIQHLNKFSIIYIIKTCLLDVKKISKHSWCMKGGPARSIHAAPHATQNRTPSRSTQQSSMIQRSSLLLLMERFQQAWGYTEKRVRQPPVYTTDRVC